MPDRTAERYRGHFLPLVQEFVTEVNALGFILPPNAPQPFLPLFGSGYERSALRLAVVGQDTKSWHCLASFLHEEVADPGSTLTKRLAEFRTLDFVGWGQTSLHFWGFAMMFLAALHGRPDWGVMKQKSHREILASFAWGNGNAIEYFDSSPKHLPRAKWELIRRAGERFNGIGHLLETLRPRAIVVLWKGMQPRSYFAGYEHVLLSEADGVRHFRLAKEDVDVFQLPHPGRMRWEGTPAVDYCACLVDRLRTLGLAPSFPVFVEGGANSDEVLASLRNSAPSPSVSFDKYAAVAWIAEELAKRASFMSVPTLAALLNDLGFRTVYGHKYSGTRGTYHLIRAVYQRLERAGKVNRARLVAAAFRRPNFEYAFPTN